MVASRRSLLKLGLTGLLIPQGSLAFADEAKTSSFEAWHLDFEAGIPARMKSANVVGAAMAIASRDNAMLYTGAFGFADVKQLRKLTADTPMHLASVSKLFTASALVQLFERKGLDLHGDVNGFIYFQVRNPHHPQLPITPHRLLPHTSSIFDEGHGDVSFPGDPTQSLSDFLRNYLVQGGSTYAPETSFLKEEPDAKWEYQQCRHCVGRLRRRTRQRDELFHLREREHSRPDRRGQCPLVPQGISARCAGQALCLRGRHVRRTAAARLFRRARRHAALLGERSRKIAACHAGRRPQCILSPQASAEMLRRQVDTKIYPDQGLGWTEEETASRKVVGHTGSDNGASNIVALSEDQSHVAALLMNNDDTPESGAFRASVIDYLLAGARLAT